MKKLIVVVGTCLLLAFNAQVHAEDYKEAEISTAQVTISKDGTGFIKLKPCPKCKNILVKITPATKAYVNGEATSVYKAKAKFKDRAIGLSYAAGSKVAWALYF